MPLHGKQRTLTKRRNDGEERAAYSTRNDLQDTAVDINVAFESEPSLVQNVGIIFWKKR